MKNKELLSDEVCLWEAAYLRFESPQQEIRKLKQRLIRHRWSREAELVELFCGRGDGLKALAELRFRHLEGSTSHHDFSLNLWVTLHAMLAIAVNYRS